MVVVMGPWGKRLEAVRLSQLRELRLRLWGHSAKVCRCALARYSCVCLRSKAKRSRLSSAVGTVGLMDDESGVTRRSRRIVRCSAERADTVSC